MEDVRPTRALWLLLLPVCLAGCMHVAVPTEDGEPVGNPRGVISAEEIAEVITSSTTAYELVRKLEPEWLRTRSARTTMPLVRRPGEGDVQVYLDGLHMGDTDNLHHISADAVARVRYVGVAEAVRYGMGHQHGVILVETW